VSGSPRSLAAVPTAGFDALLLLSFGGPEGPADVAPFLENVLKGRPVPPERLQEVTRHYLDFGGVSPINAINRQLLAGIRSAMERRGWGLPVYWGNRNWHPYLADALREMRDDGVGRVAAFVTSAYSSYSSCRQYLDDIDAARQAVGDGAPEVFKLRPFYDHHGFVGPLAEGLQAARAAAGPGAALLMSAHSIPSSMAAGCDYEAQLREVARRVCELAGEADPASSWSLVFQSRSGPPGMAWLGPDVCDAIRCLPEATASVIVVPIGFVSDHMEVVYDLDRQAAQVAKQRGITFVRAPTPGTHIDFAEMVCDLIEEAAEAPRPCQPGCCPRAGPVDFRSGPGRFPQPAR
jgi:ferrochelatase